MKLTQRVFDYCPVVDMSVTSLLFCHAVTTRLRLGLAESIDIRHAVVNMIVLRDYGLNWHSSAIPR